LFSKINEVFLETNADSNFIPCLEIPPYDLFPVHDCQRVMKADSRQRVISILSDQICAAVDPVAVAKLFFSDHPFVADADHDVTCQAFVYF
jgi:hypothetical protein